jgi:coenzyme F420-reducing hydrogenase delta subunit
MINISSAMGAQFAWSAAELTADIKRMGPNPLRHNGQIKGKMEETGD